MQTLPHIVPAHTTINGYTAREIHPHKHTHNCNYTEQQAPSRPWKGVNVLSAE